MAFSRIYMCITTFVFRAHWENASALWDNLQHIYYMYVRVRGWDDDVTFRGLIGSDNIGIRTEDFIVYRTL